MEHVSLSGSKAEQAFGAGNKLIFGGEGEVRGGVPINTLLEMYRSMP